MFTASTVVYVVVGLAALAFIVSGIRIAQEYERTVVFRLGRFHSCARAGSLLQPSNPGVAAESRHADDDRQR
jgi:regulator of protease activity HflC (stomatin/prohibitin superfamily)